VRVGAADGQRSGSGHFFDFLFLVLN
jgi:hypothetical protein